MGEGIAGLIDVELTGLVDDGPNDKSAVAAIRVAERLAEREARVAARVRNVEMAETTQRDWDNRLHQWEGQREAREARADRASRLVQRRRSAPKIGRTTGVLLVSRSLPCTTKRLGGSPEVACLPRLDRGNSM